MSITRIDFGVMATSTDVTSIKAGRGRPEPLADQHNFQTQFNNEVENQQHQVNTKNDISQDGMNADAEDKGSNEYMGDGGQNRRRNQGDDDEVVERQLTTEQMEKIADNMRDRNGKPVDLHLSSGLI
ncbi:hypothetical protein [Butyrivibrio sp. FCS014]|uniref:hypothetical protein n=1 Tax=Butyrivibrio sp. FCS014 TaxID=1408304 RepID=UPI000465179F|nr:hypothetical protein [Butyrivibrio sp. FCS014]